MKPIGIKQQLQAVPTYDEALALLARGKYFERPNPRTVRKWRRIIEQRFGNGVGK